MLQAALITLIQEEVGSAWSRDRIRESLNRAQNELLGGDCQLMRVKPDPFFATLAATYSYTPATCLYDATTGAQGSLVGDVRAVRAIYIDSSDMDTIDQLSLDTGFRRVVEGDFRPRETRAQITFDETDSVGAGLSDCSVKWPALYDPGATTIIWRAEAYLWPAQLLSEGFPLSIPEDFQESLLLQHVLKSIQRREYGKGTDAVADYKEARSKFNVKYSKMKSQDGGLIAIPRAC